MNQLIAEDGTGLVSWLILSPFGVVARVGLGWCVVVSQVCVVEGTRQGAQSKVQLAEGVGPFTIQTWPFTSPKRIR